MTKGEEGVYLKKGLYLIEIPDRTTGTKRGSFSV
jgi:hypothetical protein